MAEKCSKNHFLSNLLINDEGGFAMNGVKNTQKMREYTAHGERPDYVDDRNHSRNRVTILAGLCGNKKIGPFFFNGSVNGANYLRMLNKQVFPPALRRLWLAVYQ